MMEHQIRAIMTAGSLGSMMSTRAVNDDDFMLSDALSDHPDDWTEEYTIVDEETIFRMWTNDAAQDKDDNTRWQQDDNTRGSATEQASSQHPQLHPLVYT